jgi:APA family basic amino acid/polyamine antiporter
MRHTQLNRSLGLAAVTTLVVGNIIGSGVYKKVAPMAATLHNSGWVLACWVIAGLVSLVGAFCYAEVSGLLADTGGEYAYYKKIYNRFLAYIFGWSCFAVIQSASIASLAYVSAESFHSIIPYAAIHGEWENVNLFGLIYPFQNLHIKLFAVLQIILLSWLNTRGLKTGAGFGATIMTLVITGILLIVLFGINSSEAVPRRVFTFSGDGSTISFATFFTAMLSAFWAYQGWATTCMLGGEIKNPNRNLPLGISFGVIIVVIVYLLVNATYLSLIPISQLEQIAHTPGKIAAIEAVRIFSGNQGVTFISILIFITALGCTNATILTTCRSYYAMAREGLFFSGVAKLNKAAVPAQSLLYQCVWSCLLVFSGSFDQLTDMVIFAIFIFYGATATGVIVLRKKMPQEKRPFKVWGYPLVPVLFILFCLALFTNTIIEKQREAFMGLMLMLAGVPFYYFFTRGK